MRHNRRAVMTERYKLYMRKNIFNGRYFVRNVQVALCAVILIGLVIGGIVLANSGAGSKKELAKGNAVSALDALFGNSEEITTEEVTEATTEEVQVAMATEATTTEEPTTEPIVAYTEQTTVESQPAGEFDSKCIANVEETLNVRSTPSAEGEFVGSMNPGAIAIVEGTEGDWTKIKSGDVEGYVLTQYILTGKSAEEFAKDYVTLQGTALEDGVNVRTEQSTDANIVTVLNKDDIITVLSDPREEQTSSETVATEATTQEASSEAVTEADTQVATDEQSGEDVTTEQDTEVATQDSTEAVTTEEVTETTTESTEADTQSSEITWLPVMLADGETGYVSADLVDIDRLYEIAVSAEELQRREAEKLAAEQAAAEAAALATQQAASQTTTTASTSSSSSSNTSYQGATTTPVTATSSGECIGTFTVTAYCGCEKCSGGHNKTASGTTPTEGRTIAADTSILPFGSQVVIDGVVYTVEDRGSGVNGNHIDIFFATHDKAMAYGSKTVKVYKY